MRRKQNSQDVVFHRLHAADEQIICDHFLRLDQKSRRSRFCGAINDAGIRIYARNIFRHDSILYGAFVDGTLRGLVELRTATHFWRAKAEAAFSVEPDWQNVGIGDALFDLIYAIAQNRCVRKIQIMCLRENHRMQHLATKRQARLKFDRDTVEAVVRPYWPNPLSIAKEIFGETQRFAHLGLGWATP